MGKCTKCGTNFVGTPENPLGDGLCRYCERDQLREGNTKLRKALLGLVGLGPEEDNTGHFDPFTIGRKE